LPPANQPRPGDGFSRYEEYRGFMVQRSHQRLNPNVKDVFIYNPYGFDIRVFAALHFQIHLLWNDEFDFVPQTPKDNDGDKRVDEDPLNGLNDDGDPYTDEDPPDSLNPDIDLCSLVVNRYCRTNNVLLQRAIILTYENVALLGYFTGSLPGKAYCAIGVRFIRIHTNPNHNDFTIDARDPNVIAYIVGHELGNAINLLDHSGATTRQCVMYDTDNPAQNVNYDPIPQEYCASNPGCRLLWFLK